MLLAMARRRVFCLKIRQKSWQEKNNPFFVVFEWRSFFWVLPGRLIVEKNVPPNKWYTLSFFFFLSFFVGYILGFHSSFNRVFLTLPFLFLTLTLVDWSKVSIWKMALLNNIGGTSKQKSSNFKAHQPALLCFALLLQEWWWWYYYYLGTS